MYARKKNKASTKSGQKALKIYRTKLSQAGCVVGAARLGRRAATACGTTSSGRAVTSEAAARLGSRGGYATAIVHQLELKYAKAAAKKKKRK